MATLDKVLFYSQGKETPGLSFIWVKKFLINTARVKLLLSSHIDDFL